MRRVFELFTLAPVAIILASQELWGHWTASRKKGGLLSLSDIKHRYRQAYALGAANERKEIVIRLQYLVQTIASETNVDLHWRDGLRHLLDEQ